MNENFFKVVRDKILKIFYKSRFIESMIDAHVFRVMILSIEDISFFIYTYNYIIKC